MAESNSQDTTEPDRGDLRGTTYELFILGVSILSIVNLLLYVVVPYESESWLLIVYVDAALTAIFVLDFVLRFTSAQSKRRYFVNDLGFLDLLSCVPGLRVVRVVRVVRATRSIRRLGGRRVFGELREQFASGTLFLVIFLGLLVLEGVGLAELRFEEDAPGSNITSAGDALWWGYVTATTVGYGDQYPVTVGGRIVGVIMLTVGVALFATFSGFLANMFLSSKSEPDQPLADSDLHQALGDIERLLADQQRATAALRARWMQLEQTQIP